MIKAVLFDLDGTLLPMDQDEFVNCYFGLLTQVASPFGYDSKELIKAVWSGTAAMVQNDGKKLNRDAFWEKFCEFFGEASIKDKEIFDSFYKNEFNGAKKVCSPSADAVKTVKKLQGEGYRTVLATNPIFPTAATESRILWAGLKPEDFEYITTYDNMCFSKPNPAYYSCIAGTLGLSPSECIMVGNDVTEDMIAEGTGMSVFLLTDCLINKNGADISKYPHGTFNDLMEYLTILNKGCNLQN